jgi:chorismate synthase
VEIFMSSNSIGKRLIVTCFGESHGKCIGMILDGCPPGLAIDEDTIQKEVDKRRPISINISTSRKEEDKIEILSGIFNGYTTGAPICMLVWNKEIRSKDYEDTRWKPRPGHADYPAWVKYKGFNDYRGGGRFSGRITVAFVMAGAIAKCLLGKKNIDVLAHTLEIAGLRVKKQPSIEKIKKNVYLNPMRCADFKTGKLMEKAVIAARSEGDSVGGIIEAIALNVPAGIGYPIFDSLDADLAKALFSIPAVKGVEFGAGFQASRLKGSENNDQYTIKNNRVSTTTNNSGGILGGLSTGMPIVIRVAFKPPPSITKKQKTIDLQQMKMISSEIRGRHDACIVPRAVPIVESVVSFILADHLLRFNLINLD